MIVVDASAIVALLDSADTHHAEVSKWIAGSDDDLVTTPLIVAEVDYVVARRGGAGAVEAFWADLDAGAYLVEWWATAVHESLAIARERGRGLGLSDASLIALGRRAGADRVLTFDTRHFGKGVDGPLRSLA